LEVTVWLARRIDSTANAPASASEGHRLAQQLPARGMLIGRSAAVRCTWPAATARSSCRSDPDTNSFVEHVCEQ